MQNPFSHPAFHMAALTASINLLPNTYGRTESLGLFPSKSVRFRHIAIEERNGVLSLLPTASPGAPGTVGKRDKRKVRTFTIPHIPHDDVVLPEEVQGIRAFGTENELQAIANVITDHLQSMRNKHAITLEHLRMGALKGIILDADGTELVNLYNEFEITPKVVSFALGTAGTDVKRKCIEVLRHIEDNLRGEFMTGVHALVSPEFFDALTSHAKVKEAYDRWQEGAALRNDMRSGFTFGGITFEEYRGQATDPDGNVRRFIAQDTAHCFPLGTAETFSTYFAPADFNETVNTLGQPLYAKQEPRRFDRGTDLHTQSNPLPMCHRPGVLVKLTVYAMSLTKMFEDCFAHLGKEAMYQSSGSAPFPIRVLIKQPDTAYEMGDGQVIGHMAIFEVRTHELAFPKVGDQLVIGGNRYKIFSEPLRDASNTIWEITAMVMEG